MGKKILDSKILYVVISLLIAVSLWFYVTSTDMTNDSTTIYNVPVTFEGLEFLEDRDLMIISENPTVNIRVQASPRVLASLTNQTVQVTADVSNINLEGPHTILYRVTPPAGVSSSQVNILSGVNGNSVTIEVARFQRREVDVRGEFYGNVADGYLVGNASEFRFSPATVWISGQRELVNQVDHVRVTVNVEGMTEDVSGDYQFQLIGASGDPLEDLNVTCDVETVYTTFPIRATAEIPLDVKLLPGGGLSENDVRVKLSTPSITVAGSSSAVAALEAGGAINLGTIDLASVEDGQEIVFTIPLADELTNISGVTEVRATVTLRKRLVTKTFEIEELLPINVPEGWEADVVTQVLPVRVRGTQALMDELTEENIRVVADLQNVNLSAGQYPIPASIYLNSSGTSSEIGVLSGEYNIVVNLRPSES